MVRIDACNDSMGGFLESNMTHTNNFTIKQQSYRIINVKGDKANFLGGIACSCT
jgi:hypothetical protein